MDQFDFHPARTTRSSRLDAADAEDAREDLEAALLRPQLSLPPSWVVGG